MSIASMPRGTAWVDPVQPQSGSGPGTTIVGDAMKIYLLMLLVGVIATLSHIDLGRKSSQGEA